LGAPANIINVMRGIDAFEFVKSIQKGFWLSLKYKNDKGVSTSYWCNVTKIEKNGHLHAQCFNVGTKQFSNDLTLRAEGIVSCKCLGDTCHPVDPSLCGLVSSNLADFPFLRHESTPAQILGYLSECNEFDATPYQGNFALLSGVDKSKVVDKKLVLDDGQFDSLVRRFSYIDAGKTHRNFSQEIVLNRLSVSTDKGLYVLAYNKMRLDVAARELVAEKETIINYSFACDGRNVDEASSINLFIPEEDKDLLEEFDKNSELIKNMIAENLKGKREPANNRESVDDRPYIVFLDRKKLDLQSEYAGILESIGKNDDSLCAPMKVFFGGQADSSQRRPKPFFLFDPQKINLDQLRVINDSMKNDVNYVQGPPGTGKTNTILSVVLTAFFNDLSVLATSFNNHPVDGIYSSLSSMKFKDKPILFPCIRLGNNKFVDLALNEMGDLYKKVAGLEVFNEYISSIKTEQKGKAKDLVDFIEQYEEKIGLEERLSAIDAMSDSIGLMSVAIKATQREEILRRLNEIGNLSEEDVKAKFAQDQEALLKYLYYASVSHLLRLRQKENEDLMAIADMPRSLEEEVNKRVAAFNHYLSNSDCLARFQKIFPVIMTTNSSALKIGDPFPHFDLTVMDEASQCNTAVALLPILRGKRLLLVGDPQQLNPVIVLDPAFNKVLREKYHISDQYDYIGKSIYKCYLSVDPFSDEILLKNHYRCSPKIIEFNNRKFYNGKLKVMSEENVSDPLILMDVKNSRSVGHNTSLEEADRIVDYLKGHPKENVGVITPFVRQRELINARLAEEGLSGKAVVGTVHAFQGDEKDVILFSTAISEGTGPKTYEWLRNNTELINVASSRPRDRLVVLADMKEIERLNSGRTDDDFIDLCRWVETNGSCEICNSSDRASSALGFKPYSTEIENDFMVTLNQAMSTLNGAEKYTFTQDRGIKDVIRDPDADLPIWKTGHFDFVVYREKTSYQDSLPVFAFEINGPEHLSEGRRAECDRQKKEICARHNFELITVENCFVRRYEKIKEILEEQFQKAK